MSKLHVIHFLVNTDLPASVRDKVSDPVAQEILRNALNTNLADGRTEMHAYIKAYKALSEAGYERGADGKWNVKKSGPTLPMVHTNRPLGSDEDDEEEKDDDKKDDPGTQDVNPPNQNNGFLGVPYASGPASASADVTKRISGSSNISLNAKGKKLANELGKRIAFKGGLDVLYSSPLSRATQTADAIAHNANPSIRRAAPTSDLQPWHLGGFEGKDPKDVHDQIDHYIKHPDEVPPGKGNDGEPAESFSDAAKRQLSFFKSVYDDWQEHDPTLKIGIVTHSRGQELLQAWVDEDCPNDLALESKDLKNPADPDHATMLRWHKDKIKEVDLESDDPLTPGVYLILHSLTDDDGDKGNEELQKRAVPPHLRATSGSQRCANCSAYDPAGHCKMYEGYPVQPDQVCDSWKPKVVQKYLPPVEIAQSARKAYDLGISVIDVTAPLAEGDSVSLEVVKMISDHFADSAHHTEPSTTTDAWGGRDAEKWVQRIFKKLKDGGWEEWIACDFDGTLCEKTEPFDPSKTGAPIAKTVDYVKRLLDQGKKVRIFTARVANDPDGRAKEVIQAWCKTNLGRELPVTNVKDPGMTQLIDDRSIRPEEIQKAGNGVLIAFWPDEETQKKLAVSGGEKPEEIHLTLAYLGKQSEVDENTLPAIENALRVFAQSQPPLSGVIGGLGRFPATPSSDGKDVAYRGFHSDDIQEFRQKLVDAVEQAGGKPRKNFGYTPHITLKLLAPHAPHLLETPENLPITFSQIVLSANGEKKTFPLSGPSVAVKSETIEIRGDIVKLDKLQHLAFGFFSIISIDGVPITDTQQDVILEPTLEACAYDFVLNARKGGEMHEEESDGVVRGVGRLVESCVFTHEKQLAMLNSLHGQGIQAVLDLKCVAWWGGMKIDDEATWSKVTSGELRAWSIGGKGKRAAL